MFIKKITTSAVVGNVLKVVNASESAIVPLYVLYGYVTSIRAKDGTNGRSIVFKGDFLAISEDGEKTHSSIDLILDEPYQTIIFNAFYDGKRGALEFAVNVLAIKDSKTALGYTYKFEPLIKARKSSPIDTMMNEVLKKEVEKAA